MAGNEIEKCDDGKNFQCAVLKAYEANTKVSAFCHFRKKNKGESYNGSMPVSKTVHGGSNPSSPVKKHRTNDAFFFFCMFTCDKIMHIYNNY